MNQQRQLELLSMQAKINVVMNWDKTFMSQSDPANLQYALKYTAKYLKAVSRIPSKDVEKRERYQMTGRAQENIGKIHWRLQPAGQLSGGPEEFQPGRGELPRSQAMGWPPSFGRDTGGPDTGGQEWSEWGLEAVYCSVGWVSESVEFSLYLSFFSESVWT